MTNQSKSSTGGHATDRLRVPGLRRYWRAALAFFVLSVATGMLYRSGQVTGFTAGFDLVNIRHAHSHTMYFGWVTPVLFLFIGLRSGVRRLRGVLAALIIAAGAAYMLFLLFGYQPVAVGSVRMPISVIAATANTVIWYVFMVMYFRAQQGRERSAGGMLWDAALAFLLLATLGAFGLAFLKPLGIQDPAWSMALTHLFLDLFSEGWFVLAVLGLAFGRLGFHVASRAFKVALLLVIVGLPFTFAMGMPQSLVAPALQALARIGSFLVASGLLVLVGLLWVRLPPRSTWGLPLAFLTVKAFAQLVAALSVGFWFADHHGLRILYLHLMLLGFVSCGLVAGARATLGAVSTRGLTAFYASVTAVILSLVPLTGIFGVSRWMFIVAMWTALLPAAAGLYILFRPGGSGWTYPETGNGAQSSPGRYSKN